MMTNPGNRLTQGQFSFLPDFTDEQITAQIAYALDRAAVLEVKRLGAATACGPGRWR